MNGHHIWSDFWVVLQLDSVIRVGPFQLRTFYHSHFSVHKTREAFCTSGCSFSPPSRGEGTALLPGRGPDPSSHKNAAAISRRRPGGRFAGALARRVPHQGGLFRSAGRGRGAGEAPGCGPALCRRGPASPGRCRGLWTCSVNRVVKSRCCLRFLFTTIPLQVLLLQK